MANESLVHIANVAGDATHVIAIGVGAYGFFALPYTIIVYPFVFAVMPLLWRRAKDGAHVTAADIVHDQYQSRGLELAVALTGIIATMPYIALQLIGMAAVIKALGLTGEIPLILAFLVLALYTYSSGLRAPALELHGLARLQLDLHGGRPIRRWCRRSGSRHRPPPAPA